MALDETGNLIHQGQAGSANLVSTPERRLRSNLLQATRECPGADYICGCFAGLMTEDDGHRAESYLQALFPHAQVHAEPDFAAAYSASETGTDICVISGTGSLVCSRHDGRMAKSGGRGFILGDAGSAYQFGRDAMIHFLNAPADASGPLREMIVKLFGTDVESEIVSKLYQMPSPQSVLAKLAKGVAVDLREGHAYAATSVRLNMGELAEVVASHIQRHFPGAASINISLAGGLWQTSPLFKESFIAQLEEKAGRTQVEIHRIVKPPVYGAVQLAMEMAHVN